MTRGPEIYSPYDLSHYHRRQKRRQNLQPCVPFGFIGFVGFLGFLGFRGFTSFISFVGFFPFFCCCLRAHEQHPNFLLVKVPFRQFLDLGLFVEPLMADILGIIACNVEYIMHN